MVRLAQPWVQVPQHSRPGHPALVHAHVEAVGLVRGPQRADARLHELHGLGELLRGGLLHPAHVAGDHGHQVAGGVREGVQDEEGAGAAMEDESPPVVPGRERGAEDAAITGCPRRRHVAHPPGGPETIHAARETARC